MEYVTGINTTDACADLFVLATLVAVKITVSRELTVAGAV
jgi:hypothetical protein